MSKNKLKKFADMDAFEHVFQMSAIEIMNGKAFALKGAWASQFFKNDNPIVLELGCGRGEYTVEQARAERGKNFIGIDVKGARMWTGASAALAEHLTNVAFVRTSIEVLSAFFAPGEVSEIWITFPDPQMKKQRKRLTSTNFLAQYRQILASDGVLRLKTDSNFLFRYTEALVAANHLAVEAATDDLYASPLADDKTLQIKTYYEQQWLARGITIKYIAFRLPNEGGLIEPDVEIPYDEYRSYGRNKRSELNIGK